MNVYEQCNNTFKGVSAFVIAYKGEKIGTVKLKDGVSCIAYVHFLGSTMIRATANGHGYDRHSSACANAAKKSSHNGDPIAASFWKALREDNGSHWNRMLEDAGFSVWSAI